MKPAERMVPVLSKITTLLAVMPLIRVVAIKAFGVSNIVT
ncbi:hypothetical protein PF005_g31151 [Phytophthora fragariae]|uniref:Uncharacterized protein n=1 Tax=Phytophthora fragariae TaxID=53985 RepID=A0A6A3PHQ4_9STRA|nr:hypothetical protein PF006_g31615 [Phytophthora fragariae]KAE9161669.1 hypothetical protein PF005_g31151 [Phytophthora fragariae]KAE9261625.1 hypothetical protein PF001_g32351 [Phytophthora fragariae]